MSNIKTNITPEATFSESTKKNYSALLRESQVNSKNFQDSFEFCQAYYKKVLETNLGLLLENELLKDEMSFLKKCCTGVDVGAANTYREVQNKNFAFKNKHTKMKYNCSKETDRHLDVLKSETEKNFGSPVLCRKKMKKISGTMFSTSKPLLDREYQDGDFDSTHFSENRSAEENKPDKYNQSASQCFRQL